MREFHRATHAILEEEEDTTRKRKNRSISLRTDNKSSREFICLVSWLPSCSTRALYKIDVVFCLFLCAKKKRKYRRRKQIFPDISAPSLRRCTSFYVCLRLSTKMPPRRAFCFAGISSSFPSFERTLYQRATFTKCKDIHSLHNFNAFRQTAKKRSIKFLGTGWALEKFHFVCWWCRNDFQANENNKKEQIITETWSDS